MPALNILATTLYDGVHTYDEMVHFIHVYVIEPHPMNPDPSPYTGDVWEMSYSSKRQPYVYTDRVLNALDIEPLLVGNQLLLVDDLRRNGPDNPVWCTYGPCPNCAFLISRNGTIFKVQTWVNTTDMRASIDALLSLPEIRSYSPAVIFILLFILSGIQVLFFKTQTRI